MNILGTLETFLNRETLVEPGDKLLIAFSGGPDSTALLWGMKQVAAPMKLQLLAGHLDHGLDEDSRRRAKAAAFLSETIGVPLWVESRKVAAEKKPGESLEAASRRVRYDFLERLRIRTGAAYTLTGHHADDQNETLLLRIAFGSGLAGLSGIASRRDRLLRPLLPHTRKELAEVVWNAALKPVIDPSNSDLKVPRNRFRHLLIPELVASDPVLGARLSRLSRAAGRLRGSIDQILTGDLGLQVEPSGVSVLRGRLIELPAALLPFALSLMHRAAGLYYPPSRGARSDLIRQLRSAGRIGCDCGGGWRWESEGGRVRLLESQPRQAPFAYTLQVPGECVIPEADLRFRIEPGRLAQWMFVNSPRRTGLSLPIVAGDKVTIRNRRPGDRLRPLGCAYTRRLKDVLMDRRVPRRERDRLPLLFVDSRLAWVPGVTVNEAFKVGESASVWVVQIDPL